MSKPVYDSTVITEVEKTALNLAVMCLERVEHGTLIAMVFTDERGVFFHFMPGQEVPVVQYLASADWRAIRLSVEEHAG